MRPAFVMLLLLLVGRAAADERSGLLQESAALLAGLPLPPGSPLVELTRAPAYSEHRSEMERAFGRYRRRQLARIERWRAEHLPDRAPAAVFYPLGGPDAVNALALFPGAPRYVLVGLEAPGAVPLLRHAPRGELGRWLGQTRSALRTLLTKNLFRTGEMKADLRAGPLASVSALLLVFLARTGHEVRELRPVVLGGVSGLEARFRRAGRGQAERQLLYLRLDLSDRGLRERARLLETQLGSGSVATIFKAASYLPGQADFSLLRGLVLRRSRLVVEDDSGIPVRHFAPLEWQLAVHGRYRVIRRFAHRFQPDLDALVRRRSVGPLPFAYGYGFTRGRSHVIIARRR